MRDFTDKSRFTVRSLPEVFSDIAVSVAKLKARRPGVGGKMTREVVVNSLFCYFTALPFEEQLAIYDRGLERLVPLMEAPDPVVADEPPGAAQVDVRVIDATPPTPPASSKTKRRG